MDNDNKIEANELTSAQRHKDVLLFLNKELDNLQMHSGTASTYNLEKEYAKTKKNKSPFVFFMILACVLFTVGIAFILRYTINKQNQSIEINLEEFDSLNLKALLDSVTKVQDKYDNAVKKRDQAIAQMENEIKMAETKRDDDLFVLESVQLVDDTAFASRKRKIIAEYEEKVAAIKTQYEEKFVVLEADVEKYKKELASYDASKIESAKELEKAVSSERSVQEMERKRLVASYEERISQLEEEIKVYTSNNSVRSAVKQVTSKYAKEIERLDPVIKDAQAKEIEKEYKFKLISAFDASDYEALWAENEELAQNFQQYNDLYTKYEYVYKFIADVPQKNSIPSLVSTTNKLVNEMSSTFTSTVELLQSQKEELQAQIDELNSQIQMLQEQSEKELAELSAQKELEKNAMEQYYTRVNHNYTKCIDQMVNGAGQSAVVVHAVDKDSVIMYVVPRARLLIKEGTQVEIYSTSIIKGRILPYDDAGYYKFAPSIDEEGNEEDFNLKDIIPGAFVKILSVE